MLQSVLRATSGLPLHVEVVFTSSARLASTTSVEDVWNHSRVRRYEIIYIREIYMC